MTGAACVAEQAPRPVAEIDQRGGFFVVAPAGPVTFADEGPRAVDAGSGRVLDERRALVLRERVIRVARGSFRSGMERVSQRGRSQRRRRSQRDEHNQEARAASAEAPERAAGRRLGGIRDSCDFTIARGR